LKVAKLHEDTLTQQFPAKTYLPKHIATVAPTLPLKSAVFQLDFRDHQGPRLEWDFAFAVKKM